MISFVFKQQKKRIELESPICDRIYLEGYTRITVQLLLGRRTGN